MHTSSWTRWLLAIAGLALLFAVLLAPLPAWSTRLGMELENAGHAALFAAVALGSWRFFRAADGGTRVSRPLLLAALTAAVLAFITEQVQPLTGRDNSLDDVLTDLLGATAALAICAAWRAGQRPARRVLLLLTALMASGVAVWPLAEAVRAYRYRYAIAPSLLEPSQAIGRYFLQRRAIHFARDTDGGWRITPARSQWPGLTVEEVLPDWSRYGSLVLDVRNPGDRPVALLLRVDDAIAHERYSDRYNGSIVLAAHQRTTWRIPLTALSHRTAGRNLDLTRMRRVILFQDVSGQADPYVLYSLRLEG
jgi:hypothetical protein